MKEITILLSADLDIQTIHDSLEDRAEGKGLGVLGLLDKCFGQLRQFPESGPAIFKHFRRLIIPNSRCAIYCAIHPRRIIIRAVLDMREHRRSVIRRLSN